MLIMLILVMTKRGAHQGMCLEDWQGADMRDTLNKRQEHEHSQHSTTQRRQQEADSQGIRNIPIKASNVQLLLWRNRMKN